LIIVFGPCFNHNTCKYVAFYSSIHHESLVNARRNEAIHFVDSLGVLCSACYTSIKNKRRIPAKVAADSPAADTVVKKQKTAVIMLKEEKEEIPPVDEVKKTPKVKSSSQRRNSKTPQNKKKEPQAPTPVRSAAPRASRQQVQPAAPASAVSREAQIAFLCEAFCISADEAKRMSLTALDAGYAESDQELEQMRVSLRSARHKKNFVADSQCWTNDTLTLYSRKKQEEDILFVEREIDHCWEIQEARKDMQAYLKDKLQDEALAAAWWFTTSQPKKSKSGKRKCRRNLAECLKFLQQNARAR
jgi:hypothetical protein